MSTFVQSAGLPSIIFITPELLRIMENMRGEPYQNGKFHLLRDEIQDRMWWGTCYPGGWIIEGEAILTNAVLVEGDLPVFDNDQEN